MLSNPLGYGGLGGGLFGIGNPSLNLGIGTPFSPGGFTAAGANAALNHDMIQQSVQQAIAQVCGLTSVAWLSKGTFEMRLSFFHVQRQSFKIAAKQHNFAIDLFVNLSTVEVLC